MPEGPEIQIEADSIAAVLAGEKIGQAYFFHEQPGRFTKKIVGKKVNQVRALGKAMVIDLQGGLSIYSHNQLYGKWMVSNDQQPPESGRSLRMALTTRKGAACLFSASEIAVLKTPAIANHPYVKKLGPNCLDESLTWQTVRDRLLHKRFCNRSLAANLLDQSFIAGLGNYLRSDILFVAGVHPEAAIMELPKAKLTALAKAILALPRRSYESHGYTRPPTAAKRELKEGKSFEQVRFWAYGRENLPCRQCKTKIKRIDLTGRGMYFCPRCQA